MKFFIYSTLLLAVFSVQAHASSYVMCGKKVHQNADGDLHVTGYELELSSGNDDYSGIVGKNWNLKLQENGDWLESTKKITAKSYEENDTTIVEVSIINGISPSGPVGTKYKLIGLYDDYPSLEKYNIGGFTGNVKIDTFACFSGND